MVEDWTNPKKRRNPNGVEESLEWRNPNGVEESQLSGGIRWRTSQERPSGTEESGKESHPASGRGNPRRWPGKNLVTLTIPSARDVPDLDNPSEDTTGGRDTTIM